MTNFMQCGRPLDVPLVVGASTKKSSRLNAKTLGEKHSKEPQEKSLRMSYISHLSYSVILALYKRSHTCYNFSSPSSRGGGKWRSSIKWGSKLTITIFIQLSRSVLNLSNLYSTKFDLNNLGKFYAMPPPSQRIFCGGWSSSTYLLISLPLIFSLIFLLILPLIFPLIFLLIFLLMFPIISFLSSILSSSLSSCFSFCFSSYFSSLFSLYLLPYPLPLSFIYFPTYFSTYFSTHLYVNLLIYSLIFSSICSSTTPII